MTKNVDDVSANRSFETDEQNRDSQMFYKVSCSNISDLSVSFSPDEVGAAGRLEEGEDGGESEIKQVSLHFFDRQRRKNTNRFFYDSVFQDITSRNE